jgi:hypothetical protein
VSGTGGGTDVAKDPPTGGRSRFWRSASEVLAVVGPTSILTGILYYFGYVSAKAFYSYFGVGLSALDFSTTNYLVRSADTLFRPLATLLILMVVVFVAHHLLSEALNLGGPRWARGAAFSICVASAVLAGVGLLGLYTEPHGLWSPLSLAISALLLEYSVWTASQYADPPPRLGALIHAGVNLRRGLIAALVLTAVFWAVTGIAQERGIATARVLELSLRLQPQAVVYSEKDLHLPGPEVGVTALDGGNSGYGFRYNGLRPLLYANDRWFLLPVGWRHDNGSTMIVLQDDPSRIRVDLAP